MRAGTFHSIAHRTLRRHATSLGLPEGFSVLDPGDAADLIDMVRHEHLEQRSTERRFPRKATLLDLYSRAVNTQRPLSEVIDEVAPWTATGSRTSPSSAAATSPASGALGLLDFDDLLLHWRAAASDEHLGPALAAELDHVCVDEYQDVNALQVDLLRALCTSGPEVPGLTVVGDDCQAVYSFRGSSPRHLLDIDHVFPGIGTVALERNYRSTQPILDVANAVGEDAPEGFSTRLASVHRRRCASRAGHLRRRGRRGRRRLCPGAGPPRGGRRPAGPGGAGARRPPQRAARAGARPPSDPVREVRRAALPRGGPRQGPRVPVPPGRQPTRRAVVVPAPPAARRRRAGLGAPCHRGARRGSPGHARRGARPMARRRCSGSRGARVPQRRSWSPRCAGRRASRPAHRPSVSPAALTPLIERAYDDATVRLVDLDALIAAAADQARVSDVAADLTLEPPHSTGDLAGPPVIDEDWLVISTIHSAKGLEWDVVHLIHAADGNLPSDMALTDREGLEEERRLFYVAVTRPARALHVYHPVRFHHRPRGRDDAHSYGQPSRFLSERVADTMDRSHAGAPEPIVVATRPAAVTVELELDALWQ